MVQIETLLKLMVQKIASDLHISAYTSPHLRIDEKLVPTEYPPLTPDDSKKLAYSMLKPQQIERFEREFELDMSFGIEGLGRFRVNVFLQRGVVGAAVRLLPVHIMTFEECGLPIGVVNDLCKRPKGLVLVTGATGSGKSTTLASMVDKINAERNCHIVIIEDPIEYMHKNQKALVEQREVGADTQSFANALKHVLRQDPNVILIGEMRDLETIEAALNIAETGHLVLSTLHTSDAVQTINRVIDVFPAHKQQQVRIQLSFVLLGVLSQQLIPRVSRRGRVLASEVLIANPAVRSLVREAKTHQLYSVIQTCQKEGMRMMNQSLFELYSNKLITYEDAISRSTDPEDLERLFKR
ncbi:MAG: type IV pilus twitching motility protein PilT [Candidatus Omnitrophota bacterium]